MATLEPEGGRKREEITKVTVLNNAGKPWTGSKVTHNGKEFPVDKNGIVQFHINGGAVHINGINVTQKVQKGVENIFRYNSWNGIMGNVSATNSDNTHLPRCEGSQES